MKLSSSSVLTALSISCPELCREYQLTKLYPLIEDKLLDLGIIRLCKDTSITADETIKAVSLEYLAQYPNIFLD